MIPFIVITSIVNIGLGYWLAAYLAKGSASGSLRELDSAARASDALTGSSQRAGGLDFAWPPAAPAGAAVSSAPLAANGQESPTGAANASGQPADEDKEGQARSAMEQDLLAGIEEFRNQLAQLKAKGAFEPPVAAS